VVADLDWKGKRLGRLELESAATAAEAREWPISRLLIQRPEARLQAKGRWSALPQPGTRLELSLQIADSGTLLEQWGLGRVLKGGKGEISGQLGWSGAAMEPPGPLLSGELKLALGEGQILKVEPGAGRLLGILSLQSLPRRLTLDFRDVFQEGFSFDDIRGDIRLADGVARTSNLRLRGLQAAVLVEGSADMRRETQDLHMLVVPELNAGAASLAYAAINPAIALGTFIAQYLLREPLQQASTREFRVKGSWDQPQVEAIERPAAAASTPGLASSR
ncbi:MAG: TIGR02099 family protein, partial [Burkholderiales bacterium]|nr:TIGR02099 family protein [Burkholderiales bacterium]